MPAKLRVFISSTMEDLGNERRAVASRLLEMNFEPVNAKRLLPNGYSSWALLEEEIRDCQLFVLISGRSYGWTPDKGPGAKERRSVTHMETLAARQNGLLILPFFLALKPGEVADERTKEFRREIESWDGGYFRKDFNWADELACFVGDAVSSVLGQALRRELRAKSAIASVQQVDREQASLQQIRPAAIPLADDWHSILARATLGLAEGCVDGRCRNVARCRLPKRAIADAVAVG